MGDVVFRQQGELRTLQSRLERLLERLDGVQSEERQGLPEDERPPHY